MKIHGLLMVIFLNIFFVINAKNDIRFVKALTVICIFQNIIILLMSDKLAKIDYNLIIASKEFWLYLFIINKYRKQDRIDRDEVICIIGLFILILYLLVGNISGQISFKALIVSYRQLSLPFLFYLLGKRIKLCNENNIRELLRFFVIVMITSCIFGWIEILGGESFWERLGIGDYTHLKNGIKQIINGHYSYGGLYTYDLYPIFGKMIRRMGSYLVDAVILGQLLSVALILELFLGKNFFGERYHKLRIILFVASLLFTFAKGGYIITALTFGLILREQKGQKRMIGYLSILLMIVAVGILIIYSIQNNLSAISHVNGLIDGFRVIFRHPFGTGLGSAGNLALEFGNKDITTSGESFIGALLGQMGFAGLVIYALFFCKILQKHQRNYLTAIFRNLTIALLATSFFNNTAISYTSCFIIFIMLGALIKYDKNIKKQIVTENKG